MDYHVRQIFECIGTIGECEGPAAEPSLRNYSPRIDHDCLIRAHAPGNSSVNHAHGAFSMRLELSLADTEDRSWLPMTGARNRPARIATAQRALRTVSS